MEYLLKLQKGADNLRHCQGRCKCWKVNLRCTQLCFCGRQHTEKDYLYFLDDFVY